MLKGSILFEVVTCEAGMLFVDTPCLSTGTGIGGKGGTPGLVAISAGVLTVLEEPDDEVGKPGSVLGMVPGVSGAKGAILIAVDALSATGGFGTTGVFTLVSVVGGGTGTPAGGVVLLPQW